MPSSPIRRPSRFAEPQPCDTVRGSLSGRTDADTLPETTRRGASCLRHRLWWTVTAGGQAPRERAPAMRPHPVDQHASLGRLLMIGPTHEIWDVARSRIQEALEQCIPEVRRSKPDCVMRSGFSNGNAGRPFSAWASFSGENIDAGCLALEIDFDSRQSRQVCLADLILARGAVLAEMEAVNFGPYPAPSDILDHLGCVEEFIVKQAGAIARWVPAHG